GRPKPENEKDHREHLQHKPDQGRNEVKPEQRMPTAEKQDGRQGGHGEQVNIFRQHEEGKAKPAVFHVITGHQLRLRFRQVEGGPVQFGNRSDQEDDETEKLRHDKPNVLLGSDDFPQGEGADAQDHADPRHHQGNLVTDHLGGGAHSPQEGVLVVGGPAADKNPDDGDAGDGDVVQEAYGDVRKEQVFRKGEDRNDGEGRHKGDDRGDFEQYPVRFVRDRILLDEQLQHVGHRLQKPPRPHADRTRTVLNPSEHFSFKQNGIRDKPENNQQHDHGCDELQRVHIRRPSRETVLCDSPEGTDPLSQERA